MIMIVLAIMYACAIYFPWWMQFRTVQDLCDTPIKFTGTRFLYKKIEELSLPTELLDKTKHDKIFVLNDPDITNETLSNVILNIKELENVLSGRTANQVRSILSSILPEYKPDLASNEPVYLRIKAEAEAEAEA
jgi:FlaA1/EpsC-like NDP-sugar epimerase